MMLEMCGARMLCAGLMKLIGMLSWPVAAFKFNERIMLEVSVVLVGENLKEPVLGCLG